jgi:Na+-driven multidrug efflux pump
VLYAGELLRLMGADAAVIAAGTSYTRVLFGGSFTVVYLFLFSAVFRGAGAPMVALRALVLANGINIVLDPCFIFGLGPLPALGVGGAALATTCGRSIGVAYLVWVLMHRSSRVRLKWRHLRLRAAVVARLVAVSRGGILPFLIATASWIALMRLMSAYGAVAGYTVAIRIMDFTLLPAWGLSNAAATLVGQNLGAGCSARAGRGLDRERVLRRLHARDRELVRVRQ